MIDKVSDFVEKGLHPWTYYCCVPRGRFPNRFLDMPLYRVRVLGLILFRFQLTGFLHWGLNYWFKSQTTELIDPFHVSDGLFWPLWVPGDTFVLYPGEDGPIDSVRWENYRDAFDDWRLLETAAAKVGKKRVLKLLEEIVDFDDYPQTAEYIRKVRAATARLLL